MSRLFWRRTLAAVILTALLSFGIINAFKSRTPVTMTILLVLGAAFIIASQLERSGGLRWLSSAVTSAYFAAFAVFASKWSLTNTLGKWVWIVALALLAGVYLILTVQSIAGDLRERRQQDHT